MKTLYVRQMCEGGSYFSWPPHEDELADYLLDCHLPGILTLTALWVLEDSLLKYTIIICQGELNLLYMGS